MAFGFIKKVFSFGKKQVEERPAEDEALPPLNLDALEGFKKPEQPVARDTAAEPEPAPQTASPPEQTPPSQPAPETPPVREPATNSHP